jgi:hypothetical protein
MVVLVVLVTVRSEEQLYLGREMMLAQTSDSAQILLLVVEVLVLLAERQLELCLVVVDLAKQAQSVALRLFTQEVEEEVAFLVLPLEQGDLVEGAADRIVLMVGREPQIQEEGVVVVGILQQTDWAEQAELEL